MKEVTHEYSDKENNGNFDVELIIWHLAIPLSNKQQREIIKWTFSLVFCDGSMVYMTCSCFSCFFPVVLSTFSPGAPKAGAAGLQQACRQACRHRRHWPGSSVVASNEESINN